MLWLTNVKSIAYPKGTIEMLRGLCFFATDKIVR